MATTITRYVNTASSGGDGTTNNTSGGTAAYASLAACITAEIAARANLVTRDELLHILCCGSAADTATHGGDGGVVIENLAGGGFNTDSTRYIHLEGNPDHANGRNYTPAWSTSHYRISNFRQFAYAFVVRTPYFRMTGIQIENTDTTEGYASFRYEPFVAGSADDARFTCCIARGAGWTNFGNAFMQRDGGARWEQCFVPGGGATRKGIHIDYGPSGPPVSYIRNCVFLNCQDYGILADDANYTQEIVNCYCGGSGTTDYNLAWSASVTTCHSEDGSSGDWGSTTTTSLAACAFASTTSGSEDVTIGSGSALKDVGTDLSAYFTEDFEGDARPTGASTWDVGVDEYVAAGPGDLSVGHIGEAVIGGSTF